MAGWTKSKNKWTFHSIVNDGTEVSATITAVPYGIEWIVREFNVKAAEGFISFDDCPPTDDHVVDEKWAWNKAKLKAEDAICYIPGLPRIMWPEQYSLGAILEKARERLLERCREAIANSNFEITEFKVLNGDK
jgi:hypothetical protein